MTSAGPYSFRELITLKPIDEDHFQGVTPDYPWGRVFGGQVVAQALAAAALTVTQEHRVHSLHAYFVLGGVPKEPIAYEVDRLRDGRSFSTRRVVARQSAGAILNLDASFQRIEEDYDIQETSLDPDTPTPDEVPTQQWGAVGIVKEFPTDPGSRRARAWMRIEEDFGDDHVAHACALAYLSDHIPMDAIFQSHPEGVHWESVMSASLDHNIWFHRPINATDFILFDMQGHGLANARGMSTGYAYSRTGVHLATIAQEGLLRSAKK